jgi:hypothetical protein
MAYSDFTFGDVTSRLRLSIEATNELFSNVQPLQAEDWLVRMLSRSVQRAQSIGTEKARSEFIVAPILLEAQELAGAGISLFSGTEFKVDEVQGLTGFCDYLFSRSKNAFLVEAPVIAVVEATNDNINTALPQCVAEMAAAQIFNTHAGNAIAAVYGVVTTGSLWRFLRLRGTVIEVEDRDRPVNLLEELLGILVHILRHG